jgi:hypothetical protein
VAVGAAATKGVKGKKADSSDVEMRLHGFMVLEERKETIGREKNNFTKVSRRLHVKLKKPFNHN